MNKESGLDKSSRCCQWQKNKACPFVPENSSTLGILFRLVQTAEPSNNIKISTTQEHFKKQESTKPSLFMTFHASLPFINLQASKELSKVSYCTVNSHKEKGVVWLRQPCQLLSPSHNQKINLGPDPAPIIPFIVSMQNLHCSNIYVLISTDTWQSIFTL